MRTWSIAVASMILFAACGSPTTPGVPLSQTIETAHFSFHYSNGDTVNTTWEEAFHDWAVTALDVAPSRRIVYNKYTSRSHMGDLTGNGNTNGYADPSTFTVHTIWSIDNHETVHLYTSTFANPGPVALFNEGIAVAHQVDPSKGDFTPKWSGTPLDTIARNANANGTLPALADVIETAGFRKQDPNLMYPLSGSFVKYVLGRFGLAGVKDFFRRGSPNDTAATIRSNFLAVFGTSIDQAWQDWLAGL